MQELKEMNENCSCKKYFEETVHESIGLLQYYSISGIASLLIL